MGTCSTTGLLRQMVTRINVADEEMFTSLDFMDEVIFIDLSLSRCYNYIFAGRIIG